MIHSSIIIVYTYIWYFDYYSTVLSGKLAVATGHGMLNANRPAMQIIKYHSMN
jgi:hypothetical protein